jgi:hypothetical protein
MIAYLYQKAASFEPKSTPGKQDLINVEKGLYGMFLPNRPVNREI